MFSQIANNGPRRLIITCKFLRVFDSYFCLDWYIQWSRINAKPLKSKTVHDQISWNSRDRKSGLHSFWASVVWKKLPLAQVPSKFLDLTKSENEHQGDREELDINRKLKMESNMVNLITYLANKTDMFW